MQASHIRTYRSARTEKQMSQRPQPAQPLVSVVMPSFNSARHIREAIASVVQQTYASIELLVVDGGSSDDTTRIVSNAALTDPRVRLINNADDQGPAHARCVGIIESCGDFVAFLDADDCWLPRKIERQVAFMQQQDISFSFTRYRALSADGSKTGCIVPMKRHYAYQDLLSHRGIGTLTVMLARHLLTSDVINVWRAAGGEELLWWLLILRKGVRAHLLDEDLARYRNTVGSLSKNQMYTLKTVWSMYRTELALSLPRATLSFCSYVLDSTWRKVRLNVCSGFDQWTD